MEKPDDYSHDSKELLLIKCRDTIKQMEKEILSEKSKLKQSESEKSSILEEFNSLKDLHLSLQCKYQEQESDFQDYISKLENLLENEQEKTKSLEQEAQKYSEFIFDLQEELKSKQSVLIEWNEAVSEIEDKILKLSIENQELKEQLQMCQQLNQELSNENFNKSNQFKTLTENFESIKSKFCSMLLLDNKTCFDEILRVVDYEKKQMNFWTKEKNSLNSKIFELTSRLEDTKKSYESRLEEELKKSQKEICRLQMEFDKKSEKLKSQKSQNLSLTQQSFKDLVKEDKNSEILKKSEIIQMLKEKIHNVEESSLKELEFLKSGMESLRECFRLEISKKEQEVLLKFQPYEQDLLQEIQNLHEENTKLKTHYHQLLMYKDEEKMLLEQDKNNLKILVHSLRTEGKKSEVNESMEWKPSYLGDKNARPEKDKEIAQMIERKEQEFNDFKTSFENRWRKKTKEIQEKISAWKNKIREDVNYLKRTISQGHEKSEIAIERLEKTVSLII